MKEGKTVGEQVAALMLHIKHIETGSWVPARGQDHHCRLKQKSGSGKYWKIPKWTRYEIRKICYILKSESYRGQTIGGDDRRSSLLRGTNSPHQAVWSLKPGRSESPRLPSTAHGAELSHGPYKQHTKYGRRRSRQSLWAKSGAPKGRTLKRGCVLQAGKSVWGITDCGLCFSSQLTETGHRIEVPGQHGELLRKGGQEKPEIGKGSGDMGEEHKRGTQEEKE